MKDLSLLSHERLMRIQKGFPIPNDAFNALNSWIPEIDKNAIEIEYKTFALSLNELQRGFQPEILHDYELDDEDTISDISETEKEITDFEQKKISVYQILNLIHSFDLVSAFPNLYIAYRALCTIPSTSVSSERCFSKLKLIKTRIRSTICQNRLEYLVMLSAEKIQISLTLTKQ